MTKKITLISGFLGSGKTTLINNILNHHNTKNTAVLVNDFGDINIDFDLIKNKNKDENIISLSNGCICCQIETDLIEQLIGITKQKNITNVIIECSGVSDPNKIIHTTNYPIISKYYTLQAVFVVIDCSNVFKLKEDKNIFDLIMLQIEAGDIFILNKIDIAEKKDITHIKNNILIKNSRVIETTNSKIPLEVITDKASLKQEKHIPNKEKEVSFSSYVLKLDRNIKYKEFKKKVEGFSNSIFRAKGVVEFLDYPGFYEFQLVGNRYTLKKTSNFNNPNLGKVVVIKKNN